MVARPARRVHSSPGAPADRRTGCGAAAVLELSTVRHVVVGGVGLRSADVGVDRPEDHRVGGFGYGLLFGLTFYVPLLPWVGGFVGPLPWLLLAAMEALFVAIFGLFAVVVRRLPGWPLWLSLIWVAAEWLKSTVPFGGFPWGVVAFGQSSGPLVALIRLGGAPLLSCAVVLLGTSLCCVVLETFRFWRRNDQNYPAVLLPGVLICVVLLSTAVVTPPGAEVRGGTGQRTCHHGCGDSGAMSRDLGSTSTASGGPFWTTTFGKLCGSPTT